MLSQAIRVRLLEEPDSTFTIAQGGREESALSGRLSRESVVKT
jgi:hypothetical protein